MNQLVKNVDFLREGLTQARYAEKVKVDQSSISRLLAGKVAPSLETIQAIAEHHRVSLDDLVYRDLEKEGSSSSQAGRPSAEKLAVALVAVEKGITSMNLDPAQSWGRLSKLVLWALDLLDETYPGGVSTKADQKGFDAQVELELQKGSYDGIRKTGQDVAGSTAGRGKASAAGAKNRSR